MEDVVQSCCYGQQCEVGRGLGLLHLRADGVSSVWWGGEGLAGGAAWGPDFSLLAQSPSFNF